ncbi:MAG: response regulator, partial [Planctomycetota bacterium]
MKALIIDDDAAVREALRMTLKSARLGSVLAEDGARGLAELEADGDVGLVFLDIKMPGRDGLEILGEIRQRRPDLPIIMISG